MKRAKVEKGAIYGGKHSVLESYKTFKHNEDSTTGTIITKSAYRAIVKAISEEIMYCLVKGDEVILPSRLGSLQIVKYKPTGKMPDFNNSIKYDINVPHLNHHSNGFCIRLHWDRSHHSYFKNKSIWGFDLSKDNKSRREISLAKYSKKHGTEHFVERQKLTKNGQI